MANRVLTGDKEKLKSNPYIQIRDPSMLIRANAEKMSREECEKQGLTTRIDIVEEEPNSWGGLFDVDSIEGTKLTFTEPHRFNITVGGKTGTLNGKNGCSWNYKR